MVATVKNNLQGSGKFFIGNYTTNNVKKCRNRGYVESWALI